MNNLINPCRSSTLISYICISLAILLSNCTTDKYSPEINSTIDVLKQSYAPDRRTDRFDVEISQVGATYILSGQTTSIEARDQLINKLDSLSIPFKDRIITLPDSSVGLATWGVVHLSVCNIRSEPKHSGELATQEVMGTVLRVLSKKGEWYLVQTPNRYLGWLDHGGLITMTDNEINHWNSQTKRVSYQPTGWVYQLPDVSSPTVSDLVAGSVVIEKGVKGKFAAVELPDGRSGYIATQNSLVLNRGNEVDLVESAKRFLGVPYLWGGTSAKGFDCSGFTKTIYSLHGYLIPRDASQQVRVGKQIKTDKSWSNLIPGDLLFFGSYRADGSERITHVAIYMGGGKIIHAAGRVKIESLNPSDPDFANDRYDTFIKAKRMVEEGTGQAGVIQF